MNQIDLETLTPEQMRSEGWVDIGTKNEPHWQRKGGPGRVENYFGTPLGRTRHRSQNGTTVSRVVMSPVAFDGIYRIIDTSFDGREVGSLGICELRGDEIHLIEAAPDGIGDDRWTKAMRLYDSRAKVMEEHRLSLGYPHYASWAWHCHPTGEAKLSDADKFAFSVRAREGVCGGYFTAIILARSEGSEGFDICECYLVDKNVNWRSVPIVLEDA